MAPASPGDLLIDEEESPGAIAANIEEGQRVRCAFEERSISGDLRRAIYHGRVDRDELARQAGITADMLNDFMGGAAELSSKAFDALAESLGLTLTTQG